MNLHGGRIREMGMCNSTLLRMLAVIAILPTLAIHAEQPAFTGVFDGTGRACSGQLFVRQKTITWLSSFSKCRNMPYETIEHGGSGNGRYFTFRFRNNRSGCLYSILYLTHNDDTNMDILWNVIGYPTIQDYQEDKRNGFTAKPASDLGCPLIRH